MCVSVCALTLWLSRYLSFHFSLHLNPFLLVIHSTCLSLSLNLSYFYQSIFVWPDWVFILSITCLSLTHSIWISILPLPFPHSLTHSISLSRSSSLWLSLSLALPPCLSPRCLSLSLFLLFVSVSLSPLFWVSVLSLILFTSSNFCLSLNYVRLISLSQRSVSTYVALAMALSGDNYILHCKCCLYWEERKKSEGEDFAICILFYLCYQFLFVTYPSSTSSPLIVFSYICLFFYASSYIRLHSYSTTSLLC